MVIADGVETLGVSTVGGAVRAAAESGWGGSGDGGAPSTWGSVGGRLPEAGDGARAPDAFGSLSAGALAAPGEVSFAVDAPGAVDAADVVAGAVCFLVVAEEPAAGVLFAGWSCFLVVGAVAPSLRPAEAPSPGGVVVAVGWSGVAGSGGSGAAAAGSGAAGAGSGASGDVVEAGSGSGTAVEVLLASAAASSSATVSPTADGAHQPSASMTITLAHTAQCALHDTPGPLVGKHHPFADHCDAKCEFSRDAGAIASPPGRSENTPQNGAETLTLD